MLHNKMKITDYTQNFNNYYFTVLFRVLFVRKCVLYYCHRV
jgi:hypothetical protein